MTLARRRGHIAACVVAFGFLCNAGSIAHAESSKWWFVATVGSPIVGFVVFIDENTLQNVGNVRRAWTYSIHRTSPAPADGVYERKSFGVFDCLNKQSGTLALLEYREDGSVSKNATDAYPTMSPVAPETVGSAELDFVCAEPSARPASARELTTVTPGQLANVMMPPQPPTNTLRRPASRKNVPRVYHPH